jgi:hypothetical protein
VEVLDDGWIFKDGLAFDNAKVLGHGQVRDHGMLFGNAAICDYGGF